jgi:EpsI family protein
MRINPVQAVLASIAVLCSAVLAEAIRPRELLANTEPAPNLESMIPRAFGQWRLLPDVGLVTPSEPAAYLERELSARIYSQEVARGYADGAGNVIMFLVAYGPVQNFRLKSHLPEVCYGAAGFRVSPKTVTLLSYQEGVAPLTLSRLTAEKERRFEPVTYWMKVGNEVANGVFDRQIARMKYGLRGIIPDGALVRVSTIGLSEAASYKLQDQFIRDLLAALQPRDRKFFTG